MGQKNAPNNVLLYIPPTNICNVNIHVCTVNIHGERNKRKNGCRVKEGGIMKKLVWHHLDSIYDMFRCVMKK